MTCYSAAIKLKNKPKNAGVCGKNYTALRKLHHVKIRLNVHLFC